MPVGATAGARAIAPGDPLSSQAQVGADGISLEVQGASELVARMRCVAPEMGQVALLVIGLAAASGLDVGLAHGPDN